MPASLNRALYIIVILGLAQGLMLLLGKELTALNSSGLPWLLPWYAVAIGVPAALQLVVTDLRDRRVWIFGLALIGVLTLTGVYTGLAAYPGPDNSGSTVVVPYVLTTFIGWYVLLPFVQTYFKTGKLWPPYAELFDFAWNNIITLKISVLFTAIFWGLLALWSALFKVIGIDFFGRVFFHAYFFYPVLSVVFAFALYIGRTHVQAVVTVRRIILAIFKGLLPLLAIIIVLFLAALPFMGLKPLWATGKATALMLTLQIFLVIFLNAVFQDGENTPPYPAWLRAALRVALILLPIYTLLCAYALYLRVDQHGWSTDRFWAVLLTLLVGLYVFGYAQAALRRSAAWMQSMAPVNITIAALVVVLSILVNSPVMDARRLSANSQVSRLLEGSVAAADFDYDYLRFDLGKPGKAALENLRDIQNYPEADKIRVGAALALAKTRQWGPPQIEAFDTVAQLRTHLVLYPRSAVFDEGFLRYLLAHKGDDDWQLQGCFAVKQHCPVLVLDVNHDGQAEYLVFTRIGGRSIAVYSHQQQWRQVGSLDRLAGADKSLEQLEQTLAQGDFAVVQNSWRDLRVGQFRHRFYETYEQRPYIPAR